MRSSYLLFPQATNLKKNLCVSIYEQILKNPKRIVSSLEKSWRVGEKEGPFANKRVMLCEITVSLKLIAPTF